MLQDIKHIENFYNKGFYVFDGSKYYQTLQSVVSETKFDDFTGDEYHPSSNQELLNILLLQTHLELARDIIEKYFDNYEMGNRKIWESVNQRATLWHNDLADHTNTFFLLYHNDTSEETGGRISLRYNGVEEHIYPKAGMLILFNQENNFLHKVENSKYQRVVSSYYFNINLRYDYSNHKFMS